MIIPGFKKSGLKIAIGIDPGVKTGFAYYNKDLRLLEAVATTTFIKAQEMIKEVIDVYKVEQVIIIVEDARKVKIFNRKYQNQARIQGAGDIKAQCRMWEDWLKYQGYTYQLRTATSKYYFKDNAELFSLTTKWTDRTSEHARVAAELCWQSI